MKIIAHDDAGAKLTSELPNENLWIEVERSDGTTVYVGSLFFDEKPDGSLVVQWGSVRNDQEWWNETDTVTIPAEEFTATQKEQS